MAEDFIIDDYGGGVFYNGGGGGDFYGSGAGDDFYYGYGFDQPVADQYIVGDDFYYGYGFDQPVADQFFELPFAPSVADQQVATPELPDLPFFKGPDWWSVPLEPAPSLSEIAATPELPDLPFSPGISVGDVFAVSDIFAEVPSFEVYGKDHLGQYRVVPDLPDVDPLSWQYFPLPFDPFQFQPPSIPFAPEPIPPPPTTPTPRLPPYCPTGTYHPYPIGHPQQDICVPFPPAPKPPAPQPKPAPAQAPKPPAQQQPKPPAQQQRCPTGQWRNPQTGRCEPIPKCTTAGTVFDQKTGRCVPFAQAQQPGCPPGQWPNPQTRRCEPIPECQTDGTVFDPKTGQCVPESQLEESENFFDELGKFPWWVWALLAGVGVVALSDKSDSTSTGRRKSR